MDSAQKTPLARTLTQFAERKALGVISQLGKALPASVVSVAGSIVTVKFEAQSGYTLPNVEVPLAGSEYARAPIQPGCKGVVFPADAYLGGVSGLGGGIADLVPRGNLSSLVFFPIGNKGFSTSENPNAYVIYGPDGVIIRDSAKNSTLSVTTTEIIVDGKTMVDVKVGGISIMTVAGALITFKAAVLFEQLVSGPGGVVDFGASTIQTTGPINGGAITGASVAGGGKDLATHLHGGVQTGSGDTGPPV